MAKLDTFVEFATKYKDSAAFLVVYLEEAHPTDGWMYPAVSHFIEQHTSLKQRVAAAEILQDELEQLCKVHGCATADLPLCVDAMGNHASVAFGALPERLAIVLDGKIVWIGGKGPMEYSIAKAELELCKLLNLDPSGGEQARK